VGNFREGKFRRRQVRCIGYKILPDLILPSTRIQAMEVVDGVCVTSCSISLDMSCRSWNTNLWMQTWMLALIFCHLASSMAPFS